MTAGLPLVAGRLPLKHIDLAAERAGLTVSEASISLDQVRPEQLPAVVVTQTGKTLLVWQIGRPDRSLPATCVVSLPGKAAVQRTMPFADLALLASRCVLLVPVSASEAALDTGKGWFLDAFRDSTRTYAVAIGTTLAVNLLALPLYTMNVYDRVVPYGGVDTLTALSTGVVLAATFDFLIKGLRSALADSSSRRVDVRLGNSIFARRSAAIRDAGARLVARSRTRAARRADERHGFMDRAAGGGAPG